MPWPKTGATYYSAFKTSRQRSYNQKVIQTYQKELYFRPKKKPQEIDFKRLVSFKLCFGISREGEDMGQNLAFVG